ncbi:ABC transporter ATP-binding protein [Paenarthrobacter nitroguajacolicus]|jgi:ABC-2 type transport system ATP-binding protein|uniref:ABC transporter ATP-binding protein n=1 Tax=Paenarthrobacter nitroguajacolicus TaxID=211146 RepID=UPI003426E63E
MNGLQLTGISRSFGDRRVLHDVDLTVHRGEIVGFIGGNGAGKTTTMRVILGLLTPDHGEVTWEALPITAKDRRRIGYMPEERGLYPQMPVRDQIIHFALLEGHQAGAAREVADELIASLGLQGREQALVQDLSLGNQQRVQLAVALVGDPALLVLDEPFSGLDPIAVETMSRLIREQADRGVGVLFSSHQLELVERLCDKVCILDRGRVTASGSVVELQDDGKSRWRLAFSRTADSFAAEVSMARGVNVEFSAADRTTVLVSVDGSGRDVPGEILAAAQRHGGLKSIVSAQRSLADLLAGKFISSGPGITPGAERSLDKVGVSQ